MHGAYLTSEEMDNLHRYGSILSPEQEEEIERTLGKTKDKSKMIELPSDPLYQKIIEHYTKSCHAKIVSIAELSPGLVAVLDTWKEVDALFDMNRWEFINPALWSKEPTPGYDPGPALTKLIKKEKVGLLEGIGRMPPAQTFPSMMHMARGNLRPKDGQQIEWHPSPRLVDYQSAVQKA